MKKRILTLISIIALVLGLSALFIACDEEVEKIDYSVTLISPSDEPISDVTVTWMAGTTEAGSATTGADGKATASLPMDTYTVVLSGTNIEKYSYKTPTVKPSMPDAEPILTVKEVNYSVNVKDKDGAPAQNVTVTWTDANGNTVTATTDANGSAERTMDYGEYSVTLSNLPEGNLSEGVKTVGGKNPAVSFNLRAPQGIMQTYSVTVRSEGGLLFKNQNVLVMKGNSPIDSGKTNDEGVFSFSAEEGFYTVRVTNAPAGYTFEPASLSKTVTDAELILKSAIITTAPAANTQYAMGDIFHDYTFTTPYTLNGATWSKSVSQILREKEVLILNNWGTNCSWCLREMGDMDEVYQKYSDQIEIVAVSNFNLIGDSDAVIRNFYATNGYTFPMMRDTNGFASKFSITGWPTTVVIDRYGAIARIEVGAITSAEAWERMIEKYIGEDYVQDFIPGEHASDSINNELAKPDITVEDDHYDKITEAILKNNYTLPDGISIEWYGEEAYENAWPFLFSKFDNLESGDDYVLFASNGSSSSESYGDRVGKVNSMSILYANVTVGAGKVLTFEYFAETEKNADVLHILWDGRIVREISGDSLGWQTCYLFSEITEGTHKLSITYMKDSSLNTDKDNVFIRNLQFIDVLDIEKSTDMLRGAGYGTITDGKFAHYVDVAIASDGYYHVDVDKLESDLGLTAGLAGNDESPLLLANVMNVTPWNNKYSISQLIYAVDEETGEYAIDCNFTIDGVKKDYRSDLIRYLYAASASDVTYCVPVDDYLQKLLSAFMAQVRGEASHENEWLEICYFYSHYGDGEFVGNPIVGVIEQTAIKVEEGTRYTADITRLTAPFPFVIYTFTPTESAVYKFESFIPAVTDASEDQSGAQIWLYDLTVEDVLAEDGEARVRIDGKNEQNFELYYYMTAGHKYYFELAFIAMESGTYDFKITNIGQTYTELVPASLDLYDMVVDGEDNWTGEIVLAGAVKYEADEGGYIHALNSDGTRGDFIYLDVLNANTTALGTVPLNRLVDLDETDPINGAKLGYKMFDLRYYVRYHKTTVGGNEMVTYDPATDAKVPTTDPVKYKDYTQILKDYISKAPTSGEYKGLIKVNQEIVDILSGFIELRLNAVYEDEIEEALENEWLRFCWYNRTHDENNP